MSRLIIDVDSDEVFRRTEGYFSNSKAVKEAKEATLFPGLEPTSFTPSDKLKRNGFGKTTKKSECFFARFVFRRR